MDNRTPHNTTLTQNKAQNQKRADALRENLLKRKQQSRGRGDSAAQPFSKEEK